MTYTKYENKKFGPDKLAMIDTLNSICEEYAAQGLTLTLRQLYYQTVARGLVENKQTEYKRIGDIARDARMGGVMDWDHLIDRTRNLASFASWKGPEAMIEASAKQFHRDLWKPQKKRVEVWIEKDAAIGVIEGVCRENSVPYFSCRGYTSMSEMHQAAQRIRWHIEQGEQVTILHIGDHDPSGVDMSRDIEDRLRTFLTVDWRGLHDPNAMTRGELRRSMQAHMRTQGSAIGAMEAPWSINRIALNQDQIERYSPPPNPVKQSDARFERYVEETGLMESWELDALDPAVLAGLVQIEVDRVRDEGRWMSAVADMEEERALLQSVSHRWDDVKRLVST